MKKSNKKVEVEYSVVVPTYHESANLRPLTTRLYNSLKSSNFHSKTEIIIVDDNSNDGSEQEVQKLSGEGYPIRIIIRRNERGLSSAVLHGFNQSKGSYLLCMDADLQHPPEKVPQMFQALKGGAEFVLGTRYGGKEFSVDKDWPLYRQVISKGARLIARPLTPLSDPMSGFFGMTRQAYERAQGVSPLGFKIALELYVKARIKKHEEVPIVFGLRTAGESKLTGKVFVHYLRQLVQLYGFVYPYFPLILLLVALVVIYVIYSILI